MISEEHLYEAYNNSFRVLILGYDVDDMLRHNVMFAHNPMKKYPTYREVQKILNYFKQQGELKKCIAIKTYLDTHQ
tara:strand:- start:1422 stop:1649 length:228 start_codon:yes stop_codon:yes gene_type:complete